MPGAGLARLVGLNLLALQGRSGWCDSVVACVPLACLWERGQWRGLKGRRIAAIPGRSFGLTGDDSVWPRRELTQCRSRLSQTPSPRREPSTFEDGRHAHAAGGADRDQAAAAAVLGDDLGQGG